VRHTKLSKRKAKQMSSLKADKPRPWEGVEEFCGLINSLLLGFSRNGVLSMKEFKKWVCFA